jgi:hypothetical protein
MAASAGQHAPGYARELERACLILASVGFLATALGLVGAFGNGSLIDVLFAGLGACLCGSAIAVGIQARTTEQRVRAVLRRMRKSR